MNTEEAIKNYKNKSKKFKFEMLEDGDVKIISGNRFEGMLLSDIFVVDPGYIDWLIKAKYVDKGLKMSAMQLKSDANINSESISRQIALGE